MVQNYRWDTATALKGEALRLFSRKRYSDNAFSWIVLEQEPGSHQSSSNRDQPVVEPVTENALFVFTTAFPNFGE